MPNNSEVVGWPSGKQPITDANMAALEQRAIDSVMHSGDDLDAETLTLQSDTVAVRASGTYTGDGTPDRTISLPFTPLMVIVHADTLSGGSGTDCGGFTTSTERGTTFQSGDIVNTSTNALRLLSNGFEVDSTVGPNDNGEVYNYVAIGK